MTARSRSQTGGSTPGWLASLVGAIFLISAGFMLGLVVGVVKEEPELVMNHIAGESEEVAWSDSGLGLDEEFADSASGLPGRPAYIPNGQGEGWPELESDLEVSQAEAESAGSRYPPVDLRPPSEEIGTPAVASSPPAKPPLPQVSAAPPPANRSGFSVQVGAFSESVPAHKVADELRAKGYDVYITPSASSRDGRWRVRVGPLSSREKAQDVAHQLKVEEQLPTWVLSEGGG